jgi:hypothetical protein
LLFLSQCGGGEESGSLSPLAERNLQLEHRAVEELLTLYQEALRQEDIDRLQELLQPGNPPAPVHPQRQTAAGTAQSAAELRRAISRRFRNRDLLDVRLLEPDIRLEANGNSASFVQVETSVAGHGAALVQRTVAMRHTLYLARQEDAGVITFRIAGVVQEAPQLQVVTPGRVLAGTPARVTVRETTGTMPLAAVEVEVPETGTVQPLRAVAGVFSGIITPPARRQPQPLRVRIRGAHGERIALPHRYRLRGTDEGMIQRLDGTGAARFSAVAVAPDGTVWAGGAEPPPGRGAVQRSAWRGHGTFRREPA